MGVELDGQLIGCVGVRVEDQVGELGGEIDPDFWRRGYCREALVALMEHARSLGVTRFSMETRNPSMVALGQGLGLVVLSVEDGETTLATQGIE
ncbi:MAG: GNAT family N-acetyltransferase [Proteobacteria bacterium]|nr:GNAT family N-acetyltransferase [Pseudomonadota bacterium]MCP4918447.1 GNAT family N-acetyltransferase [Pseudomonadota bacterium]